MKNQCYRRAEQGFSSEISRGRRAAKFARNLTKYMSVQHIWDLSRLMGLFLPLTCKFILKLRHCNQKTAQNYRPGVCRLLLRKTGHWPVHDIKSFAIGAFLSSLLLKEQMISAKKKNLVRNNTKSKAKPSGSFEHKIAGFKKATFIISRCFCCCCYCTG